MSDVDFVEKRLRESGVLDGLTEASASETQIIVHAYRDWALRLAPYLLRDPSLDVATALALYRQDHGEQQRGDASAGGA